MPFWQRAAIAAGVFVVASIVAKVIDWRLGRRLQAPETITRYRVIRRSLMTAILVVGFLSALLVIPQIRAVAGGILASSAVVGLVIGFAAQRTLANFVAGVLIAITQPLRLGDHVVVDNAEGVVEEIGLTYTFIRTADDDRVVIPNDKLASDTIRNSTIRSLEKIAEITVQVPLSHDLGAVLDRIRRTTAADRGSDVFVSALDGNATITVRAPARDESTAQRLERELRLRVHAALREEGVFA